MSQGPRKGMALTKMPRRGTAGTSLSSGTNFVEESAGMLSFGMLVVSSVAVRVLNGHLALSEVELDADSFTGACVEK